MQRISEVAFYRDYHRGSIEKKVTKPSIENYSSIDSIENNNVKTDIPTHLADAIINSMPDLVEDKYRPFFFKKLYQLGTLRFTALAEHARKYGKQKSGQLLFVKLLKEQGTKK